MENRAGWTSLGFIVGFSFFLMGQNCLAEVPKEGIQGMDLRPLWGSFRNGPQNRGVSQVSVRDLEFGLPGRRNDLQNDRQNDRQNDSQNDSQNQRTIRSFEMGGIIWGTPIVDENGNTYVGSSNKFFYSFDGSGNVRWKFKISDEADSLIDSAGVLSIEDDLVVVPGGDGNLYFLDRNTGALRRQFHAHHASEASHKSGAVVNSFEGNVQVGYDPAFGRTFYAGSDNGYLYAVTPEGQERWSFGTKLMVWSSPALSEKNDWLAFGSLDGNLYLLDPQNGQLLAPPYNANGEIKSSPAADSHRNLYFGTSNGELVSVKIAGKKEGKNKQNRYRIQKNWSFSINEEIYSSPAIQGGKIVFGSIDGNIYALSNKGELLWKYSAFSRISSSPLITADGVVIFGAKNGKIYALDLQTGERIWSYLTTLNPQKSNLDSSVTLDASGVLHVGSYSGVIYHIPYEYCLMHRDDQRCQYLGKSDPPLFSSLPPQPGYDSTFATLQVIPNVNLDESQGQDKTIEITAAETIQLKLAAFEKGQYISNAAIDANSRAIHVHLNPPVEVVTHVSSDGKYLNIRPKTFFDHSTRYHLKINGRYFTHASGPLGWLADRFKWIGLKKLTAEFNFQVKPASESLLSDVDPNSQMTWGLHSMYLSQPEALDTYIPAALDGQGFLGTAFAFDPVGHRFLMLALPGYPQEDGSVKLMAEPSKVFTLNGRYEDNNLAFQGHFKLSAMGGEIPLDEVVLTMGMTPEGNSIHGQLNMTASCLGVKGSGSNFTIPWSLINLLCDPWLKVVGLGSFAANKMNLPEAGDLLKASLERGRQWQISLQLRDATSQGQGPVAEPHVVSLVQYDPQSYEIFSHETQVIDPSQVNAAGQWSGAFSYHLNNNCIKPIQVETAIFLDSRWVRKNRVSEFQEGA